MAISSNRSPSPISSRTNSNSRIPEGNSGARKSFSANPFTKPSLVSNPRIFDPLTPANSPSDLSRRNLGCKERTPSLRLSYEHKENEKEQNLKTVKVRSPSVSKVTKSFMAPTISAASKIAASPRKKVLAERNEAVRTSISVSDGTSSLITTSFSEFAEKIDSKSEMVFDSRVAPETQNPSSKPIILDSEEEATNFLAPLATSESNRSSIPVSDGNPSFTSMNPLNFLDADTQIASESLSEPKIMDSKHNNADLHSEVEPSSSPSTVLASLGIDSPLPPYDPKTNYLSPRPQFLHYKPKPRIEASLNKERGFDPGEGKRLEDSFTSESCSDTENTEVPTQSSGLRKESDDISSSEMLSEEEDETHVSEPESVNTHKQKKIIRVKEVPKSNLRSFARLKTIPLLLVLLVACLSFSVIDSPVLSPSVFRDQTFPKLEAPAKITELAKANFDGLAYNFMHWSVKSISYLSKLTSIPRVGEEQGPFHFINLTFFDNELLVNRYQTVNLTVLDNEVLVDRYQTVEFGEKETEERQEHNCMEPEKERETEDEPKEEHNLLVSQAEEVIEEVVTEECSSIEFEGQSPLIPQAPEVKPEISEAFEFQDQKDLDSHSNIEPTIVDVTPQSSKSDAPSQSSDLDVPPQSLEKNAPYAFHHGLGERFPAANVLGISSILMTLIAATAFLYLKQEKASTPEAAIPVQQLPQKVISSSVSASSDSQHSYHERLSSRNWPTEVEMVGESCPSEMSSSFQKSSSCNRRESERAYEVQSHERREQRNSKRESLAASSEYSAGSTSYGSFTTYEKIHNKHGCENEVVTPVRRSSRIRKQITSP